MTNLECVRPCYANNASGLGDAAAAEIWHDESKHECRNIYFTPLVHSMYALHLRRWLKVRAASQPPPRLPVSLTRDTRTHTTHKHAAR